MRTENGVPVPHFWERGGIEVFQPKLVIFRAEPDIDASIRTCVPSKRVLSQILANHPRTFQWLLLVQWTIMFRQIYSVFENDWIPNTEYSTIWMLLFKYFGPNHKNSLVPTIRRVLSLLFEYWNSSNNLWQHLQNYNAAKDWVWSLW